ncbi:MAG TPA: hypothetical protein VL588_03250, partial [Bdellovibrionota bacterium]|nr:hypothetical protein [Bdellovibrionota bacterium]
TTLDPLKDPLINVAPDGTDTATVPANSCTGGGAGGPLGQCPGQAVQLCALDTPNCGCRGTPGAIIPRQDCTAALCSDSTGAISGGTVELEGSACTCGAVIGGDSAFGAFNPAPAPSPTTPSR